MQVRTFDVSDYQPLVSNGIITTESTLHDQPDVVRGFVQATIRGLKDVIANPAEAVQISQNYVQGMDITNAMSVLQATIPIWQGDGQHPLGYNDNATWQSMEQFLVSQKSYRLYRTFHRHIPIQVCLRNSLVGPGKSNWTCLELWGAQQSPLM